MVKKTYLYNHRFIRESTFNLENTQYIFDRHGLDGTISAKYKFWLLRHKTINAVMIMPGTQDCLGRTRGSP